MKLSKVLLAAVFAVLFASEARAWIGPLIGSAGMAEWLKAQQENNGGGLTNGQLDAIGKMPCSNPGDANCSSITGQPPAQGQLGENEYFETFNGQTMFCVGAGAGAAGPPFCQPCDKSCQEQKVAQAHETRQKEAAKLKKNEPVVSNSNTNTPPPTNPSSPAPGATNGQGGDDLISMANGGGIVSALTQDSDKKSNGGGKSGENARSGNTNPTTGGAYDPQGTQALDPTPSTQINGVKIDDLMGQVANTLSGINSVTGSQSGYRPNYGAATGPAGSSGGGSQQTGGGFVIDCAGSFESICTGGRKASNVAFETARKLGDNLDKDAKGAGFQGTGTGNKSFGK